MPVTMIPGKTSADSQVSQVSHIFDVSPGVPEKTTLVVKREAKEFCTVFLNEGSTVLLLKTGVESPPYNSGSVPSGTIVTKHVLVRNTGTQVQLTVTGKERPTDIITFTIFINDLFSGPKEKGAGPAPSGAGPVLSVAGPAASAPSGNAWEKPEKPPTFTDDQQKEIENAEQKRNTAVTDTTSLEKKVSDLEKALSDAKKELESAKRKEKIHNDVLSSMRESFICQNELASFESAPSKVTPVKAEEPSDLTAAEVAKQMGWTVAKKNK